MSAPRTGPRPGTPPAGVQVARRSRINLRRLLPALLANLCRRPDRGIALARYEQLAPRYEDSTVKIRQVRARAIERLAPTPGETVFDVACGAGAMLAELAARVAPHGHVVGIEQSPPMAEQARRASSCARQIEVHEAPVESFATPRRADALVFVYAHDVQQNRAALANVFAQARPGARVVAAGMCLLPWWRAAHFNVWVLWGARKYLSTWHGLREPWRLLREWCPDLEIVERFHDGTTYLATGSLTRGSGGSGRVA